MKNLHWSKLFIYEFWILFIERSLNNNKHAQSHLTFWIMKILFIENLNSFLLSKLWDIKTRKNLKGKSSTIKFWIYGFFIRQHVTKNDLLYHWVNYLQLRIVGQFVLSLCLSHGQWRRACTLSGIQFNSVQSYTLYYFML